MSDPIPMKLQAAMFIMAKREFSILECEAVAKDLDLADTLTFDLVGPKGRKLCRWIDAYYGTFEIVGEDKTLHTKQVQYVADIHCENLGA